MHNKVIHFSYKGGFCVHGCHTYIDVFWLGLQINGLGLLVIYNTKGTKEQ